MRELQSVARRKIHYGKLDEFKRPAAAVQAGLRQAHARDGARAIQKTVIAR